MGEGDVNDRVRGGAGGCALVGVLVGVLDTGIWEVELGNATNGGKWGIIEATADHRLGGGGFAADVGVGCAFNDDDDDDEADKPGVGDDTTFSTGLTHFSKNRITGISAAIVVWVLIGKLGKGKWMTAFALGGGRGGSATGPAAADPAPAHRSAHHKSNTLKCSSAFLNCAALGNGAES